MNFHRATDEALASGLSLPDAIAAAAEQSVRPAAEVEYFTAPDGSVKWTVR